MELRPLTVIYLALSALVSAIVGGLLFHMLLLAVDYGVPGMWVGLVLGLSDVVPILLVAPPAMLVGGLLWAAGARRRWVRGSAVWAATGAFATLFAYAFIELDLMRAPTAALLTIAGAVAALTFRRSMTLLTEFGPQPRPR